MISEKGIARCRLVALLPFLKGDFGLPWKLALDRPELKHVLLESLQRSVKIPNCIASWFWPQG